jgi:hypothetical protein
MARSWEKANPMKATKEPINMTAGRHTSTKQGGTPKGGAGRQIGPSIASGYLVSGKGDTHSTGGYFRKANSSKLSKRSSKKGRK